MSPEARRAKGDELIRREKYLENCKPAMIQSRKKESKINAKTSIEALKAEKNRILAELGGFQVGVPALALAA